MDSAVVQHGNSQHRQDAWTHANPLTGSSPTGDTPSNPSFTHAVCPTPREERLLDADEDVDGDILLDDHLVLATLEVHGESSRRP